MRDFSRSSAASLAMSLFRSGCAGTSLRVESPAVRLSGVEIAELSFSQQTFLLGFDIENPNPFPLPVRAVQYRVLLDGERFAGGETQSDFTVPARGDDSFVISVDLDFLNSATQLVSLLRGGMREEVAYELDGSLAVDIPFVKPLPFRAEGVIAVGR